MWTAVSICMLGLFIFWIKTLDFGLSAPAKQQDQTSGNEKSISDIKEEIPSLWQSLKAGAGDLFETINKESKKEGSNVEPSGQQQEEVPPASLP